MDAEHLAKVLGINLRDIFFPPLVIPVQMSMAAEAATPVVAGAAAEPAGRRSVAILEGGRTRKLRSWECPFECTCGNVADFREKQQKRLAGGGSKRGGKVKECISPCPRAAWCAERKRQKAEERAAKAGASGSLTSYFS